MTEDDLNRHIVKLKTRTEAIITIADSGSPMWFLNGKTALRLQENDKSTIFKYNPSEDPARNLVCYNGKYILPKGKLIIAIESGGWALKSAPFIIVDDQKTGQIGRNLLPPVEIKTSQEKPKQYQMLSIQKRGETVGQRQFQTILHKKIGKTETT